MSVKDFIPPVLFDAVYHSRLKRYGWFGDYADWQQAASQCTGYDHAAILEKVKNALLKVRNGEVAHERDSVVFDKIDYSWPVLAGLLCVAARHTGVLNVLDFGGSLGSTYFQNRKFLAQLNDVKWNIVEQENFVKVGKEHFQTPQLRFYPDIEVCIRENQINAVVLSSVLPYLEKPFDLMKKILDLNTEWIILDKMPFIEGSHDRITIQKVPPYIYEATYPAWFFSEKKFIDFVTGNYELIEEFESNSKANIRSVFKGLILKIRK